MKNDQLYIESLRQMSLVHRARDVYSKGGITSVATGSIQFTRRVISPVRYGIALASRGISILNRHGLREYCEQDQKSTLVPYASSETVRFDKPISPDKVPHRFKSVIGEHYCEQPFVAVLSDCEILENGLSVTNEGHVILESARSRRDRLEHFFYNYPSELFTLKRRQRQGSVSEEHDYDLVCPLIQAPIPTSTLGSGGADGHSAHVLTTMPRLRGLRIYIEETGKEPTILFDEEPRQLVEESLQLLGFSDEDWDVWNGEKTNIRRMVVPSIPRFENDVSYYTHNRSVDTTYKILPPSACKWVRKTVVSNVPEEVRQKKFPRRIYISRADASDRRVRNHKEVMDVLSPLGFESLELSELSFYEQVQLFSEADAVIGPHGAGLVNLMFADRVDVIEIFGSKTKPTFFMLSQSLNHRYGMLRGKPISEDIYVEMSGLRNLLRTFDLVG